jgi:hypothetical protein
MALLFRRQLNCIRAVVTRGPERGKLNNLQCWKPVARERLVKTQQAGNGLADFVVICKVERLAVVHVVRSGVSGQLSQY